VARSCPVADASGALVLRGLGPTLGRIGWPGTARPITALAGDHLFAKPDRAGSLPAERVSGAGRGRPGAVGGCLPRTSHVCCEWHACGTVDENEMLPPGSDASSSAVE
jgi:hypothetical protein